MANPLGVNTGKDGRTFFEARGDLPVGPLRAFLERMVEVGVGTNELARRTGVPERAVTRILHENAWVRLDTADKLITRLGGVFVLIYPLDDEKLAA